MDFDISKDQKLIRQSIKDFLKKEWAMERTREMMKDKRGYDKKTWKKMAELGFTGLVIPDEYGGPEGEFLEIALLMEEIGRSAVPCPVFPTAGQCVPALVKYGSETQKERLLPGIAEKADIWTLALTEKSGNYEANDIRLRAEAAGDGFVLKGEKTFVPYANAAKYILVAARTQNGTDPRAGVTLFAIDTKRAGVKVQPLPTAAPGVKCNVIFDNVQVSGGEILGELNDGWKIVDHIIQQGAVLKAAEMLGGIEGALKLATQYAKERIQFGRPIGSFQAIQHKLVEMMIEAEALRGHVYEAAWHISNGTPSRLLNAMAKLKANTVYHRICFDAIGIHGAIGWTAEMDISLYLLRSKDLENDCGATSFHKEQIAVELVQRVPDFKKL